MAEQVQPQVCVVTGASRSVGQAIAAELGALGAVVYVTGRRGDASHSKYAGDTLEDTAELGCVDV